MLRADVKRDPRARRRVLQDVAYVRPQRATRQSVASSHQISKDISGHGGGKHAPSERRSERERHCRQAIVRPGLHQLTEPPRPRRMRILAAHAASSCFTGAARWAKPDASDNPSAGDRRGSAPALTACPAARMSCDAFASRSTNRSEKIAQRQPHGIVRSDAGRCRWLSLPGPAGTARTMHAGYEFDPRHIRDVAVLRCAQPPGLLQVVKGRHSESLRVQRRTLRALVLTLQ